MKNCRCRLPHPPIIGGFVGCLAMLQAVRRRTFAQGGHSVFIRTGGKLERFHQLFKTRKCCGGIHGNFPFKRVEHRRQTGCHIWRGVRRDAARKPQMRRKGAARRNGVDSNGSPNGKGCLRRRGGWPAENPAKPICRQSRQARIGGVILVSTKPKPFAWAIRGWRCA